jgi:hypothetical protein
MQMPAWTYTQEETNRGLHQKYVNETGKQYSGTQNYYPTLFSYIFVFYLINTMDHF